MIKISIIVPIYNREQYLAQCLDSLIKQSLRDIEIICVNDGSTDGSLDILKNYALNDQRIVIINQVNKGASAARNSGIEKAKGQYLAFVDSDDFVDLITYDKVYQTALLNDADVVMFGMNIHNSITGDTPIISLEDKVYHDNFGDVLYSSVGWGMCNGIFRRSLLSNNDIRFAEDIADGEDRLFLNMILPCCKCVVSMSNIFYFYRKDGQLSLTNGGNDNYTRVKYFLEVTERTVNAWKEKKHMKIYNKQLLQRTLWLICEGAEDIEKLDIEQKEEICTMVANIINGEFFLNIEKEKLSDEGYGQLLIINKYSKHRINILGD